MSATPSRVVLWFHSQVNPDWSPSSYERVFETGDAEELGSLLRATAPIVPSGVFFAMKAESFPAWEHPSHQGGGCMSYTIPCGEAGDFFAHTVASALSPGWILPEEAVNGVSVSPKKGYCVVRIWLRCHPGMTDAEISDSLRLLTTAQIQYKSHQDSMQGRKIHVARNGPPSGSSRPDRSDRSDRPDRRDRRDRRDRQDRQEWVRDGGSWRR